MPIKIDDAAILHYIPDAELGVRAMVGVSVRSTSVKACLDAWHAREFPYMWIDIDGERYEVEAIDKLAKTVGYSPA